MCKQSLTKIDQHIKFVLLLTYIHICKKNIGIYIFT